MLLLEFNKKDKWVVSQNADKFTISVEFELETEDTEGTIEDRSEESFLKLLRRNLESYIKDKKKDVDTYRAFYNNIINILDLDDEDYVLEILDESEYDDEFEKQLIQIIKADYLTYWNKDNVDYLAKKVEEHLPNFFKKWWETLKFEIDTSLKPRGVEFSCLTYVEGLHKGIEMVNDFYDEFEKQDYWRMSKRSGMHVNIGRVNNKDWNVLKGVLLISDLGEESLIFKNMKKRMESPYAQSFLPQMKKDISSERELIIKQTDFLNLQKLEMFLNKWLIEHLGKWGHKNYGFNILYTVDRNYVEFRYPGGDISREVIIDKIWYFAYITYLMTEPNFKKKQYIKKLYKLATWIEEKTD